MLDKVAGYTIALQKMLEIMNKKGIETIDGEKVRIEDDFVFYFDEMLRADNMFGKGSLFEDTFPTDYPKGSTNTVVILSRYYRWDRRSTLERVYRVKEKDEDRAAKLAFVARFGEYGLRDEDLTWVTVVDPSMRLGS
ncbi:hypothetical protein M413DRAFT_448155 [Hebeloma cylindrosporum]|uniref:Uncharacterized protein n=1 Tax=Hebeloma cylindrosporum TaxID=76867 RepID=A0A0C2YA30_HEBCY|nr:hypothetical protein M413DRAFT_448155 [Hebeloma cylindrosporum h7]